MLSLVFFLNAQFKLKKRAHLYTTFIYLWFPYQLNSSFEAKTLFYMRLRVVLPISLLASMVSIITPYVAHHDGEHYYFFCCLIANGEQDCFLHCLPRGEQLNLIVGHITYGNVHLPYPSYRSPRWRAPSFDMLLTVWQAIGSHNAHVTGATSFLMLVCRVGEQCPS